MESVFHVAPKLRVYQWLGARTVCGTAANAVHTALQMAQDEANEWATILVRRWELVKVRKGDQFAPTLEAVTAALASLPADGQKAPRGKRKLEVYEILKGALQWSPEGGVDAATADLMTMLRPYLK